MALQQYSPNPSNCPNDPRSEGCRARIIFARVPNPNCEALPDLFSWRSETEVQGAIKIILRIGAGGAHSEFWICKLVGFDILAQNKKT